MEKEKILTILKLHILLLLYSFSSVLSKLASGASFFSMRFLLCYGGMLLVLAIYAVFWQQMIKKLPLTTAFANKAVTVVWGILWGTVIFQEKITPGKLVGALLVVAGVIIFGTGDREAVNG